MDDDEMNNLELVEALMNRASGIETKEEGDKLDRLILSGEISTEDIDEANKEVEIIRSLLPLVNRLFKSSLKNSNSPLLGILLSNSIDLL